MRQMSIFITQVLLEHFTKDFLSLFFIIFANRKVMIDGIPPTNPSVLGPMADSPQDHPGLVCDDPVDHCPPWFVDST